MYLFTYLSHFLPLNHPVTLTYTQTLPPLNLPLYLSPLSLSLFLILNLPVYLFHCLSCNLLPPFFLSNFLALNLPPSLSLTVSLSHFLLNALTSLSFFLYFTSSPGISSLSIYLSVSFCHYLTSSPQSSSLFMYISISLPLNLHRSLSHFLPLYIYLYLISPSISIAPSLTSFPSISPSLSV